MQQDLTDCYIYPGKLNLQDYPQPDPSPSQNNATFNNIDNPIPNQQVVYGGGHGDLDMRDWDNAQCQDHLGHELNFLRGLDFSPVQAQSAPTKGRGGWGFDDDSTVGRGGLPAIVRESGPWNHIKQKFATSVPGPVHSSSQDYQIPTSSQGPSNLVGLGIPQTSTGISWHHSLRPGEDVNTRDAFLRQYGTDITTYSLDSGNNAPYDMQVSHSGQVGQGGLNNGSQDQVESLRSSTSSPLQFPDLEMEDGPQQPSFSGDVLPRRSNLPTRSRDTQTGWRSSIMEEHDDDIPQNRIRESRQPPQLDDPSFLTPYGHPLHQQLTLKSVGYQFPYPEISGSDNPNHHHLPGPQAWTNDDRYNSAYNGTAGYTTNYQSLELDHPNAIRIPTTSDRYESDRPSSFPITAHFFPNNLTNTQVIPPIAVTKDPRRRRVTIGTPSPFSIQMQRKISSHRPAKASRSDSLEVIREDGQSLLRSSPTGSFKGRRTGPLSKEARAGAKQKRIERSVCIRCYMMKQKCEGEQLCEGCRKNSNPKSWGKVCMKANFLDSIEAETCNAVFQRSACHPTLDGRGHLTIDYPSTFNVNEMLKCLEALQSRYKVRVCQPNSSYTLDLVRCFDILTKVHDAKKMELYGLHNFMENKPVKASEWLVCAQDYDQNLNVLDRAIKWCNMPSRNSYEILSLERPGCAHPLNIENEEEKGTILFAIQLTRIIVRAVEIEGFNTLQRSFNDLNKKDKDDTDTMLLTRQLGQLLFSLRLRIAWWAIFGDGSNNREFSGTDSTDRVTRLTHQLYCWYFVARKKLPSWKTPIPDRLKSVYPEIGLIVENLPKDDSMIGFDIWMQEGQALIHHAMATQNLAPYS